MSDTDQALPKGFGTTTATFVVVSSMVGVGVLTTSGFTVLSTGSNAVMLALWAIGGLIAVCGALTQCELSAAMPKAGGDYVFLREAYGPLPAFLSGWVSFLIGFAAPIAVAASASARYLLGPLAMAPEIAWVVERSLASLTILVFAAIHVSGQSKTTKVQGVITVVKIGVLVVFATAGLFATSGQWSHLNDLGSAKQGPEGLAAMLFSLVYIGYGYTGWNAASYIASEIEEPQKRLPRAILIGTAGVTLLYLAINTVYALALSSDDIQAVVKAGGPDAIAPIAERAAERLFSPSIAKLVALVTGVMLWSTLSAYVLTGPRVLFAMAQAGQFPAFAGRIWQRTKTPAIATALQVGWALVLLWSGTFSDILVYAGVGLAIFSMLTVAAIFPLRIRQPDLPRPFVCPFYPFVPLGFIIPTLALTSAAFSQAPRPSLYALGSILLGIPVYYLWGWIMGRPTTVA